MQIWKPIAKDWVVVLSAHLSRTRPEKRSHLKGHADVTPIAGCGSVLSPMGPAGLEETTQKLLSARHDLKPVSGLDD
jgi:hypothetical protein